MCCRRSASSPARAPGSTRVPPTPLASCRLRLLRFPFFERPEDNDRAARAAGPDDRDCARGDVLVYPAGLADPELAVERTLGAHRDRRRYLVVGQRLVVRAERTELAGPLRRRKRAGFLEAASEQRAGRLVVKQQDATVANEERGRRDAR